jgi:hypothetical protein
MPNMCPLCNTRLAKLLLWWSNRFAPGLYGEQLPEDIAKGLGGDVYHIRDERRPGRRSSDVAAKGSEMTLAYDKSRCQPNHAGCDVKDTCARFTEPGRPEGWQSMLDASVFRVDGIECGMFIANQEAPE